MYSVQVSDVGSLLFANPCQHRSGARMHSIFRSGSTGTLQTVARGVEKADQSPFGCRWRCGDCCAGFDRWHGLFHSLLQRHTSGACQRTTNPERDLMYPVIS
jgi:hypothetical protein